MHSPHEGDAFAPSLLSPVVPVDETEGPAGEGVAVPLPTPLLEVWLVFEDFFRW